MSFVVAIEGLLEAPISTMVEDIERATFQAVNKTAERTRAASARQMNDEVAFPAQYLAPSQGRLVVSKQAKAGDPEAVIRGRGRPTALARFATSGYKRGAGVSVEVEPGRARYMPRAFFLKLRSGASLTETKFNLGLAIRIRPGETPSSVIRNKRQFVKSDAGLYLLYGPSVDQVFRTVAVDQSPAAAEFLENEFLRLMDL
jgi:hypothetical protein